MKILVTGAKGQLGRELVRLGTESGHHLLPLDRELLDITDPDRTHDTVTRHQPGLIINAAAYTRVDAAEKEPGPAFRINDQGPGNLAAACAMINIPLIHVSTDYVFDGTRNTPYTETDPVSPMGVYGRSKEAGERRIRSTLNAHVIVRTSWLYSVHGHNFVKTMLKQGRERETLRVVADQYGSPTSAADLARALLAMADTLQDTGRSHWGTFHYCGRGTTSWHGFAQKIIGTAKKYGPMAVRKIVPVTTAEYSTPARRPAYSALDCGRIRHHFDIHPVPWEESLEETIWRIMKGP